MIDTPLFETPLRAAPVGALVIALLSSCGPAPEPQLDSGPEPTPPTQEAELSELSGGGGPLIASAGGLVVPEGYIATEYAAAGVATDYAAEGALEDDGRWTFRPVRTAEYRTRVLVRRPEDPSAASGTVIVEWLNVTSGADADPGFAFLVEEITRRGHTWVGVSAQLAGIEGGEALVGAGEALGLVGSDPERYGSLTHPGDGFSFDIFTQVARALRRGDGLGGLAPVALIAAGESQSAFALTTYYDGVQPRTLAFDGFFVHSRAASALPLVRPGTAVSLATALFSAVKPVFRGDLEAPVMELQAEGDVTGLLASFAVRQPDSATFRLWEVAGTAHADAHLLGAATELFDCGGPINDGPMHVVAKAAFASLESWVRTGDAPAMAERLEVDTSSTPTVQRDGDGIALGGVRTPPVDVPVDRLSGEPAGMGIDCMLFGSTVPLSDARLAELYGSRAEYEASYAASLEATLSAGFALEAEREALSAYAQPTRIEP